MTTKKMNPDEEYEFYALPENQVPQGPPRRRSRMTEPVPVRFPPATLDVAAPTQTTGPYRAGSVVQSSMS